MDLLIRPNYAQGERFRIIEQGSDDPVGGDVSCIVEVLSDFTQIEVDFVTYPDGGSNIPCSLVTVDDEKYIAENGIMLTGQYKPAEVIREGVLHESTGLIRGFFHIDNVRIDGPQD